MSEKPKCKRCDKEIDFMAIVERYMAILDFLKGLCPDCSKQQSVINGDIKQFEMMLESAKRKLEKHENNTKPVIHCVPS